ncbi:MAG: DUF2284 domain-containing protein [Methanosphaera sp.]|uniref:DUF2284 domain-containing protein n=1 Tax=Methanosphaera sp. TaxID=2666342 RepID=UPI0025DC3766|nr:DUF2284 domain-containing protein [Methanosphaera sp.]MCI5867278.1 DUF2284 domain-containing protein [Methanosphaera sp.]MDD6534654.1 DUF2284 domain-containing protein [Methanosphaera sp.]MDY3955678.1 DUF2284 domain-containing protein [Methanosphaera sp.]
MDDIDFKLTMYEKTMKTDQFYEQFNNYDEVQSHCRNCFNYEKNFTCSPVDIDIKKYITSYEYVDIIVSKLDFKPEVYEKTYSRDELNSIINNTFMKQKDKIKEQLRSDEANHTRAVSITGPCDYCGIHCREKYDICPHPEKLRYSLASLGIESSKILKDLFDIDLILIEKGKLPRYMNNVSAILYTD